MANENTRIICSGLVHWQTGLESNSGGRAHPLPDRRSSLHIFFINLPLSFSSLSPKVRLVSVTCLMVTECVRSSSAPPASGTVAFSHLWATQISGHLLQLPPTRTPTAVPPMLPLGSHLWLRYEGSATQHIKDFQWTIKPMSAVGPKWKRLGCFGSHEWCFQLTTVFVWPVYVNVWPQHTPNHLGFSEKRTSKQIKPEPEGTSMWV